MMTRPLQLLRVACLLMLLTPTASLIFSSTEESEVRAISNPHCSRLSEDNSILTAHGCDHHLLLSPHRIIVDHKATQPDTLIGVTTKKILSVPVPVYHFHQPARISEKQLPFQLVLLSNIDDKTGLIEISVPHSQSIDSWFPGYQWAPIVYVSCGNPLHVGWKFSSTTGDFFYALIVATSEKEKATAARVGIGTIGESVAEILYIGTRAPLWMIDTLTRIV
mmetsp:Transcript_15165/g.17438  ORF Transcript_15165/g.17438 Transcript_15165/m.17438 type:complete len:221 (+) Transcript_15165:160-822(+)